MASRNMLASPPHKSGYFSALIAATTLASVTSYDGDIIFSNVPADRRAPNSNARARVYSAPANGRHIRADDADGE